MPVGKSHLRLGFLASHNGSSMAAMLHAISTGKLDATAAIVISNNANAGALDEARRRGIASAHISRTRYGEEADKLMASRLSDAGVNLVILSGYMRKLGPAMLERFAGRILNIHPSLLPKFGGKGMYGRHVHEAVIGAGETQSGISVHVVTAGYDEGPVLAQIAILLDPGDTVARLEERIKAREADVYIKAIQSIARGDIALPALATLDIRPYRMADEQSVITLWTLCDLTRSWNDPAKDIARKLTVQPELFIVAEVRDQIVGTVMAGYEGHRGWINYLAVHPDHQRRGIGRALMTEAAEKLQAMGCPKINLQVRHSNLDASAFYRALGYLEDDVMSMGKRLIADD